MAFANWSLHPATLFSFSPVVPVIVINRLEDTLPLARALLAGGIKVLEITLRTSVALEAIELLTKELPEAIVGAGTVTNPLQLKECSDKGAKFALSPGLTRDLLLAGKESATPLIPGASSVSELMEGMQLGYCYFKFFPAEMSGGINLLKTIYGLFPQLHFCPTGGINHANYLDYLALPNVNCVGGSWIVPEDMIREGCWDKISEMCLRVVDRAPSGPSRDH